MNLPKLFNTITGALLECQSTASKHVACRSIPDDTPHCYRGAWSCMQSLLSFKKPTDAEAKDLLCFVKHHTNVDTMELQDLCEYFADVHDINFGLTEI